MIGSALHAGDLVGDRYEIEGVGATGGMGTVYRAIDRRSGERVAVKLIGSHDLRLAREINALAELSHPSIVRYIDHRREGDRAYLVMDWLEGIDLGTRLKSGPLPVADCCALLERIANGLAATHARGIVHRDIKPRNLMLVDRDAAQAVIVDFGIARRDEDTAVTMGGIIGTPRYMAPEQATGQAVGPRADIYSLGCVVFECLTGQTPFAGPDAISLMAAKVMANPPRVRDFLASVPPALDALLDRMLARDPFERPTDGGALVALLPAVWLAIEQVRSDDAIAVTRQETRIATVVLARGPDATASGATVELVSETDLTPIIGELASRSVNLSDGTLVVSVDEPAELVDRVALAARSAAALAKAYPHLHVALATGPLTATAAGCEVIDRATALLVRQPGRVWLDSVSADLLARTHRIEIDRDARWLGGEQANGRGKIAPFVGRERERRMLQGIADECLGERVASVAVVLGESGLGKTRLVTEVARGLPAETALWTVRADPMAAGAPYALLAQLVRWVVGLGDELTSEERRHRLDCTIALHFDDQRAVERDRIVTALGAMLHEPWGLAAAETASARAELVRRGWEDWVGAVTERQPLVLAIDDLHLADATSLAIVDGLLRACRNRPLLVLGTARPELATAHARLWESRGVNTIALAPLTARAAANYLAEVAPELDAERRGRLIEHAGGSPFLLEELARAAAGPTDRHSPLAAVAIVQARLDRLAPDLRRVLRAASVFGRDFTRDGVVAVLAPITPEEIAASLRALEAAEVIDLINPIDAAFRHDLVRDAAYAALPERDRALAHRRAAAWLVARDGIAPAVIAGHFAAATMAAEATAWWATATEHAHAAWDLAAVLRFGALAASGLRGEALGALEELRATAYRWSGALDDAEYCAGVAVRELPERDPRWYAAFSTQLCMRCVTGHTDGTDVLIEQLCEAALADGTDQAALAIGRVLAQFMLNDSAFDRAWSERLERTLARVLALAKHAPSDELAIVIADIAGERALEVCDHASALRLGRDVQEREERRGNVVPSLQQLAINGYYLYELGQIDEARRALETAMAGAREREIGRLEAHAHHNLGVVVAQSGDLAAALHHERRALDYYSMQQDHRMVAGCRMYLAHILIAAGEFAEAEREVRAGLDWVAASKYAPFAWAILARALLGQDRVDDAADALANATPETRMAEGWAWIALTDAEIRLRRGRHADARAIVAAACAEIDRRLAADTFAEPGWRTAYITGVEAHRRLLALRDKLTDA